MSSEHTHSTDYAGWAKALLGEMELDPISLWQIVGAGKEEFLLDGKQLEDFVRIAVQVLLEGGGRTVRGCSDNGGYWMEIPQGHDKHNHIDFVIHEWKSLGNDFHLTNSLWFARPEHI